MTREEAKQMFRDDINSQGRHRAVLTKVDKIYDSIEQDANQRVIEILKKINTFKDLGELLDYTFWKIKQLERMSSKEIKINQHM